MADDYIRRLGIKTASSATPIGQLSGGNQQRCCSPAGWPPQPALLILDEPTRGIDVRAKEELMDAVRGPPGTRPSKRADVGAVHLVRAAEVLHCSDRVLVMRDRHVPPASTARRAGRSRRAGRDRGRCAGRCR